MANNYLQFSDQIEKLTADEKKWWEAKVAELEGFNDKEDPTIDEEELGCVASSFDIESEGIWVHADECGNPDFVAVVIQDFLKAHRPSSSFGFQWAFTCSKLRIGEFGGGGCFITAKEIKWFDVGTLIHNATLEFEKAESNE